MKTKHGTITGLMIASFVFALSICLFCFGYILSQSLVKGNREQGLLLVIASFPIGLISSVFMMKCRVQLKLLVDFGTPVFKASHHIKEIIRQVNIYGIDSLKRIVEKTMKDEIQKAVKGEKK